MIKTIGSITALLLFAFSAVAAEPRCQITILGVKDAFSVGNSPVSSTMTDGYKVPNGYRITYYRVRDVRDCKTIASNTVEANKVNLNLDVTVQYEELTVQGYGQEN